MLTIKLFLTIELNNVVYVNINSEYMYIVYQVKKDQVDLDDAMNNYL